MEKWEVKCVNYNKDVGALLLIEEGWEPFAITCLGNPLYSLIWLRRKVA